MRVITLCLLAASLTIPEICFATTWGGSEVSDPIAPTTKCKVHEPMSSGSYIYEWPEKYDQVFWPFTDENGIWFCSGTGFTAFIGDFEDITPQEIDRISEYLKNNYKGNSAIKDKLKLLEGIYSLRKKDEYFSNRLLRILARWYQNLGDLDASNAYRHRALQQIQESLRGNLPEENRLEYLYVAANYSRLFGNPGDSDRYAAELGAAIKNLSDKKLSGFAEYLSELVKDTPKIKAGGKLNPEGSDDS